MGFRIRMPFAPTRDVPTGDGRVTPVVTRRGNTGPIRARSYAYRSTAVQPVAGDDPGVATELPLRGEQPDAISVPASEHRIDANALNPGRSYLGHTEDDLNDGPTPKRIRRDTTARNHGYILPGTGHAVGMDGWPYDGSALFVPHVMIPRRPITVTPFQRTIDTSITVSAPAIGSPSE